MSVQKMQIRELREQNIQKLLEAVGVFLFSLFVTAFLPQLLFKYFYANAQLTEQPPLFDYIQVGSFVLGVGYFLFVMVMNAMRSAKIRKLTKELVAMEVMGDSCCNEGCCGDACCSTADSCCSDCGGNCTCTDHDNCACGCDVMSETEKMAPAAEMKKTTKRRATKKTA